MSLSEWPDKQDIIAKHRVHERDTGSPEVQIALLTKRIDRMSEHFKKHIKDQHSKRGMLAMIGRRKRLLQFLKNEDVNRYKATLASLGLRK